MIPSEPLQHPGEEAARPYVRSMNKEILVHFQEMAESVLMHGRFNLSQDTEVVNQQPFPSKPIRCDLLAWKKEDT